jgi:hypothetical protein
VIFIYSSHFRAFPTDLCDCEITFSRAARTVDGIKVDEIKIEKNKILTNLMLTKQKSAK